MLEESRLLPGSCNPQGFIATGSHCHNSQRIENVKIFSVIQAGLDRFVVLLSFRFQPAFSAEGGVEKKQSHNFKVRFKAHPLRCAKLGFGPAPPIERANVVDTHFMQLRALGFGSYG
jgi:hypothetical protein